MKCLACKYWCEDSQGYGWGDCRRHAPIKSTPGMEPVHPKVRCNHWCGDYEEKCCPYKENDE